MNGITVTELIERLQDCDPDAEVRLATQPNWPLQYHLAGIATTEDIAMDRRCEDHDFYNCEDCAEGRLQDDGSIVYLVEGSQHYDQPYAPRAAWDVVR
ncbi:hypothetical protein [Nocardioides sp. InS609-2]|uniref:hypothetical protein n=1 Tax=Nocardioides sp. InS609-2 TaxID=2760705 RepID=UPI0020C1090A|nr:hypothetical protein [Nocardioides sp. InS609-2]